MKINRTNVWSSAALVLLQLSASFGLLKEFTVNVEAGVSECFYETVKAGQVMDVEYQVIDGDRGELDINFHWSAPSGRQIVSDFKKAENSHRHEATEDGDYKMCWDNSISRFNSKTVFFEFLLDQDQDDWFKNGLEGNLDVDSVVEKYEMTVDELKQSITRVHTLLSSVRQMQDVMRAYEARDRNFIEGNFELVNRWSIIQVFIMVLVGGLQVYMVRSLFDDKNRVHQIWKSALLSR
ncbi:transmembrane emp24 domain-containing protein 5-like [Thrips palmi]|uniref:Transmembrane emp24 domain-containing protein 5-like n=1 Tax=Thrips palmi TaxID=161013 RepID=A0A6P8ZAH2_THRPL|nr:transmembrane emp24 domain-containing protein 5-like [Thrips palmi]